MLVSNRFSTRHVEAPTKEALSLLSLQGKLEKLVVPCLEPRAGWVGVRLVNKIDQYQQNGEGGVRNHWAVDSEDQKDLRIIL